MKLKERVSILMPDLRGGGAERVSVNLANCLSQRGFEVEMVLLSGTGELLSELRPEIHVVDLKNKRIRWVLFPLIKYLRRARPAAVLACMWPLTVVAVVARALSRVKLRLIVAEHSTWSRSELLSRPTVGWQIRTSMHLVFPDADGIVAVSQGAADDLCRFANLSVDSVTVIHNPVVGGPTSPSCTELAPLEWWTGSHYKLLAVGTLKNIKDYATLLQAVDLLRQRMNVRLLILGEGDSRPELELHIKALGLEGLVFMPGFVKDPQPYFHQTDLHVLSSKSEALPTVIIEALAAGTPVVSTDCPSGPREILCDGQFGRLVPVGDPVALANAMAESLEARHDTAALKERAQFFSIDKATDRYIDLLFPRISSSASK